MKLKTKIWLLMGALMTLVLLIDISLSYRKLNKEIWAEIGHDAREIYGIMMATRRVFQQVFIDKNIPITNQTIGLLPAHAMSRISKDFGNWNQSGILFNNVSDNPRNPSNMADQYEMVAIRWFREHPKEKELLRRIITDDKVSYLHYSAPIYIEPYCLNCHGEKEDAPESIQLNYDKAFGYKEGDLRGLVSIKVPTRKFDDRFAQIWGQQIAKTIIGYAILFFALGMLLDRLVLNRLVKLKASATDIANGAYHTRVESLGADELTDLANTFNKMALRIEHDLAEKQKSIAQINHLANYDDLTGLPNRSLLSDRIIQLATSAKRSGQYAAIALINIDRFKTINNARGISFGDQLLINIGKRISKSLREGDTLAHLAADEFALILPNLGQHSLLASRHALSVIDKIHHALLRPFSINNEKISITASFGITLFPEELDNNAESVIRRANTAIHRAKENGGNQTAFFETDMGEIAEQRFQIERSLRSAIDTRELRLYLQPQVDNTGQIISAEVLLRWQHPERGLLPPGIFIPIAEESDLIIDLDSWVLSEACQLLAQETVHGNPLHLSVNLSPRHFRQRGFVPWLRDMIRATGVDPTQLTLEVTEGILIEDIDAAIVKMNQLAEQGIHFSLDDFGTGHSSLSYLKRLPIHELKIDKIFVQDAPTDPDDAALVETILSVASHLHLKVVAEGVETQQQVDFFKNYPSVLYQGYFYGKPKPAHYWIRHWNQIET